MEQYTKVVFLGSKWKLEYMLLPQVCIQIIAYVALSPQKRSDANFFQPINDE
jgi:hypothetical protein